MQLLSVCFHDACHLSWSVHPAASSPDCRVQPSQEHSQVLQRDVSHCAEIYTFTSWYMLLTLHCTLRAE